MSASPNGRPTIDVPGGRVALPPPPLTSLWDGLSPHLIATFYRVMPGGSPGAWMQAPNEAVVKAPLTEASMEVTLNWQSPFEQSGPESRAPALMAMLQSGQLQPVIDAFPGAAGDKGLFGRIKQQLSVASDAFVGRTGITKLNSTQVFSGMPPVKIQVTALFRAWRDPAAEVEAPFSQLMAWALPIKLASDGSLLARMMEFAQGSRNIVDALVPSFSPTQIAMKYKGRLYSPLVIESISQPMESPVNASGRYIELAVPMTLCTLTALDRQDWAAGATTNLL
jgi:hypothetical protein